MPCTIYRSIKKSFISDELVLKTVKKVFSALKQKQPDISVHFIGDKKMRHLNREHRGIDRPTDVLSFSLREGMEIKTSADWGDIFICMPQIRRQAKTLKLSGEEESVRMLVHGILHLAGFDHKKEAEAKKMFSLQDELIRKIL